MNELLLIAALVGQITVKDSTPVGKPIIATCTYPLNADQRIGTAEWSSDGGTTVIPFKSDLMNGIDKLYVWAEPGDRWLKINLVINKVKVIKVWVADDVDPSDKSKMRLENLEVSVGYEFREFQQKFIVTAPRPPPDDDKPDPPKPDDDKPPPSPNLDSPLGLVRVAYEARGSLPTSETNAVAQAHLQAVRAYAVKWPLADGEAPRAKPYTLISQLQESCGKRIAESLDPVQRKRWASWSAAINRQMDKLQTEGEVSSIDDWMRAYVEIAWGLELK